MPASSRVRWEGGGGGGTEAGRQGRFEESSHLGDGMVVVGRRRERRARSSGKRHGRCRPQTSSSHQPTAANKVPPTPPKTKTMSGKQKSLKEAASQEEEPAWGSNKWPGQQYPKPTK